MQRLYYYPLKIDQTLMEQLMKFGEQLNRVLHTSMTYDQAFKEFEEIIHRSQLLSRKIREAIRLK